MAFLDLFRPPVWRVEPATTRHAAVIAQIHAQGFARGWSAAEIEALLTDRTIVADILRGSARRDVLDGFALSRLAVDEAEVLSIAVAPRRRAKGGGQALFSRHLARLQGVGARRVVLEVDENNEPARRLYAHFGFEEVATRTSYYGRGDGTRGTALVLARMLG